MVSAPVHATGTPRLDSLTSLRWWAALAVFFFHVRNIVPLPGVVGELARYGNFGVAFFFILSGFVLTWSWRSMHGLLTGYVSETLTFLFAMLICAFTVSDLDGRSRLSRVRPLVALGEWSYAFYLIHATLIYIALGLLGTQSGVRGLLWIAILLLASILAAWCLHAFIERPVERRMRTWQNNFVARRISRRAIVNDASARVRTGQEIK